MDTRFGIHTPSDYNWVPPNLITWCEDAKRHGVNWITLWANCRVQVEFAKALTDHGIRIIYRPGENKIPAQFIGGDYEQYRNAGAEFCQFYNEPNLKGEWNKDIKWGQAPEIFAELWAEKCKALKSIGFTPVVPPLSPGGELWHPDFFHRMFQWWKDHGMLPDLLRGCVLGIHNRPTKNHPDDIGVCSFEGYRHYRQWMLDLMGFTLPMVAPEAGYQPEDMDYDWQKWCNWNLELIRRFRVSHPKYVGADFLCHNFWIYSDLENSTWNACGLVENWHYAQAHNGDRTTNLWRALEAENWGTVPTPTPSPTPTPTPEPEEPMDIDFDGLTAQMKATLSITGPQDPTLAYWKVRRVEIQPDTDNQSAWLVTRNCPGGLLSWPGTEVPMNWKAPDPLNPPGTREGAFEQTMHHAWGPYGMRVMGNSETLRGFGLYGLPPDLDITHTGHRPVVVYFELAQPGEPEPEPEPGPQPETPYSLETRLAQAPYGFEDLREQVQAVTGVDMARVRAESLAAGRITASGEPLFGRLRSIVLHHLGAPWYGWENYVKWAVSKDNATAQYHFVVEKSGKILWLVAIKYLTHHAGARANQYSISISFEDQANEEQMEAGRFLIASLYEFMGQGWGQFRLLGLYPHSELGYVDEDGNLWHDQCPGDLWPAILWSGPWPDLRRSL